MSTPIDLTQDSDGSESDSDLNLAIAMSLSQADPSTDIPPTKPRPAKKTPQQTSTTTGILGLDRKQMEADRLARQTQLKRKRALDDNISPPPLSRRMRTTSPPSHPSPRKTTSKETKATPSQAPTPTLPQHSNTPLQYPNGTIKRTWISSYPRTDRDITFSELVDAPNLKSALLSSFIWDFDWLFQQFHTKETKFVLVMHAHSPRHASQLTSDFSSIPNIRVTLPPTSSIGCMHSKLLLLFYGTRLRIAIPTANLTPSDWGECGRLENMLFMIDLPLRDPTRENNNDDYPFYTSLVHFLSAQAVPADVLTRLLTFDFAATLESNIAFVHTISGSHTDPKIRDSTGRCGLASAVRETGLVPKEGEVIQMDYVCSSVGSLTEKFLEGLHAAASGRWEEVGTLVTRAKGGNIPVGTKNGIKSFFDAPKAQGSKSDTPVTLPASTSSTNLRIYFPSTHTINASLGGPNAAGTICFQRRWWEGTKFPRGVLRDCVAVPARRGVLMHSKVLFVRVVGKERGDEGKSGWVYVGSANCSESAWGSLSGSGKGSKKGGNEKGNGDVKLTCRNWECGVVVPVPMQEGVGGLVGFEMVLPVPMVYPGGSYEENTDLGPWFFGEASTAAS